MIQRNTFHHRVLLAVLTAVGLGLAGLSNDVRAADAAAGLNLVPWPKSLNTSGRRLALGAEARIVASSNSLTPLARVVAGELQALFGRKLPVAENAASRPGDIVLAIAPGAGGEEYRLEATDRVQVSGGNYAAVAAGTVTLLQSLKVEGDALALPIMTIADAPAAPYRGLMLDPARCWHSPEMLRQCITLCRWYKIRFLQLHLTDDQSFTFPSQVYPKLPTPGRHYTLDQLRQLEQYATERGVVLVPEYEMPGHSGAAVRAMPGLFAAAGGSPATMNFARPEACRALDTIIGEMAAVFRATPYLHIGADECDLKGLDRNPDFQAAMKKTGLPSPEELYRAFLVARNQTVKWHGKQTIIWEGFRPGGKVDIPRDILVMVFESLYNIAPDLIKEGHPVINTTWQPLYVVGNKKWSPEHIFGWNMYRWESCWPASKAFKQPIVVSPTDLVRGAQMCSWENRQETVIPFVRQRLAAMSERTWNPAAGRDFADFARRLRATDAGLTALLVSAGDGPAAGLASPRLPNIVYILTDDLGYGDVHALNPQRGKIPTPHLDKFAAQGMVFTDAHSSAAVCTPSRYGVLTGRYNWRTRLQMGVFNVTQDPALIAADRLTVPKLLKKHGYHTAGQGKWHLGWTVPVEGNQVQTARPIANGPTTRGFDEFFCVDVRYSSPYMFTMNDRFTGTPLREWTDTKKQPPTPPTDADYEDVLPRTTDATIEYLARRAADNRPFFAYVTPMAPHSPLSVVKSWQGRSGLGIYADYVMELDAEIGRILAALDRHGLADNTLVMVTSDNGCAAYVNVKALEAKGHFPSERSRGYKADLWDGGHRIPFLVRWPGKVAPGSRCDHPVCLSDLMATCAEIVGERLPDNAGEDSVSLLPLLQGQRGPARDSVIHHSMLGKFAIRQGKWKLLLCAGSGCGTQPDDFRAEKMGLPKQQLYDMEADPGERNNLQAKHPEIVERLTKLLYKQINDGRSTPGKPQANDVPIDVWKRPDLMSWNIRAVLEQKE